MNKRFLLVVSTFVAVLVGCSKENPDPPKNYFTLWNTCESLTALQEYVQDVTDPSSRNFIKKEDRIATFDMDGTFVGELYPTYFEYNLLEYRVLDDPAYRDKAPEDVKEPEEVKIEEKEKPKKDGGVKKKIHNVFSVIKKMLTDPEEEEEITDEN